MKSSLVTAIALTLPSIATAGWSVEVIDASGPQAGWHNRIALGPDGPAIAYHHIHADQIRFAERDGSGWAIETVAERGGRVDLAFDAGGEPHLAFGTVTTEAGQARPGAQRYAVRAAEGWLAQDVDGDGQAGGYTSVAVDAAGRPHIGYWADGDLRYAHGPDFEPTTLDAGAPWAGEWPSTAVGPGGQIYLCYRYVRFNSPGGERLFDSFVKIGVLESGRLRSLGLLPSSNVPFCALDVGPDGDPQVAYFDEVGLAHARYRGALGWQHSRVPAGPALQSLDLSLDRFGRAHIVFTANAGTELWYASNTWGSWALEPILTQPTAVVSSYCGVAVAPDGGVHVSFASELSALYYARRD